MAEIFGAPVIDPQGKIVSMMSIASKPSRSRAVIRDTFRITKVGTIAGCYVTSGVIERNARVRVIREGVVVFPPADKVVGLDSLKRFKDDAKEVREGFECGIVLKNYNDIKVGDIIEAYRFFEVKRTL